MKPTKLIEEKLWKRKGNMGRKIHGLSNKVPEYSIWGSMKQRCYNKNHPQYKNYGGRGIIVCDEWKDNFLQFYKDMGSKPSKETSIERIDNSKGYFKENCRWATSKEQGINKRNNDYLTFNGKTLILSDWAKYLQISQATLWDRLYKYNWTIERALSTRKITSERLITFNGKTQSIKKWSKELNFPYYIFKSRMHNPNYTIERAFTEPVNMNKSRKSKSSSNNK